MQSYKAHMLRLLPFPLAALMCCGTASAEISDTIHPFVAIGYTYDDNLLRLPDNVPGLDQRSDRSRQAQAGIIVDRPIGRQRLTGRAKVSRVTFDHYDQLDYNGKDFSADLAWQLTSRAHGNIGGTYMESLTPFTDFHTDARNLRKQRSEYVNGAFLIFPSWQVRGAFSRNEFTYELPLQRFNNRDEDVSELGMDYLARSGSRFGILARRLKGTYFNPRFSNGAIINDNYSQDELNANVSWLLSAITQVQVLAGYARREHDVLAARNSSGANGRVTVRWAPFKKVRFNAEMWREFAAVESSVVTNSLNKGASVGATWDISAKLQATATARRLNRDFERSAATLIDGDSTDRITGATVGLTWAPTRTIQVNATAFHDKRSGSSLIGSNDYRANGVSLNASAQF